MTVLTPAELEKDILIGVELLKCGAPCVELALWNRWVVPTGRGYQVTDREPPAPAPVVEPNVADAVTAVNESELLADLMSKIADGDMLGVGEILANAGLRLERIEPNTGEPNVEPSDQESPA